MSGWGPDMRGKTEPTRPDVVQRHGQADGGGARAAAYFGAEKTPVEEHDARRPDVANPRREDKRRGRAYTAELEDDLL